jgi:hypothetical protein
MTSQLVQDPSHRRDLTTGFMDLFEFPTQSFRAKPDCLPDQLPHQPGPIVPKTFHQINPCIELGRIELGVRPSKRSAQHYRLIHKSPPGCWQSGRTIKRFPHLSQPKPSIFNNKCVSCQTASNQSTLFLLMFKFHEQPDSVTPYSPIY